MAVDGEAGGGHLRQIARARINIEGLAAQFADEVVMVTLAGEFVPWRLARQFDRNDLSQLFERTDGAVNGCDSDCWDDFRGLIEYLLRAQGV